MGIDGDEQFGGVIGKTVAESEPWWPEATLPPAGTPNVVMILLDDTGIAHLGCFGSPIDTPNFDGSRPSACATPTSTRRRCARHRGRAC